MPLFLLPVEPMSRGDRTTAQGDLELELVAGLERHVARLDGERRVMSRDEQHSQGGRSETRNRKEGDDSDSRGEEQGDRAALESGPRDELPKVEPGGPTVGVAPQGRDKPGEAGKYSAPGAAYSTTVRTR